MASSTKKPAAQHQTTGVRGGDAVLAGSLPRALTGYEEEDAGCEGLVKPVEGGVVDEGHDADDDADETRQEGEDHEGPGGVPIGCVWREGGGGRKARETTVRGSELVERSPTGGSYRCCRCVSCISQARSTATGPGACNCWSGGTASSSPLP